MADEKNDPPKVDEGAGTPAPKTAAESGGASSKPDADPSSKTPPGGGTPAVPPKPPAAPVAKPPAPAGATGAPAKPAAAPKAPIKPDPWTSQLVDELQKRFPGAISEPVTFRNQPSLNVAKEHLLAVCEFLKATGGGAY